MGGTNILYKKRNEIISNSNTHNRLSAAEVTVNCALPRQYCGFSTAMLNGGRLGKFGWRAQAAFKEDVVYVFTVPDISNTGIVTNIFT